MKEERNERYVLWSKSYKTKLSAVIINLFQQLESAWQRLSVASNWKLTSFSNVDLVQRLSKWLH